MRKAGDRGKQQRSIFCSNPSDRRIRSASQRRRRRPKANACQMRRQQRVRLNSSGETLPRRTVWIIRPRRRLRPEGQPKSFANYLYRLVSRLFHSRVAFTYRKFNSACQRHAYRSINTSTRYRSSSTRVLNGRGPADGNRVAGPKRKGVALQQEQRTSRDASVMPAGLPADPHVLPRPGKTARKRPCPRGGQTQERPRSGVSDGLGDPEDTKVAVSPIPVSRPGRKQQRYRQFLLIAGQGALGDARYGAIPQGEGHHQYVG